MNTRGISNGSFLVENIDVSNYSEEQIRKICKRFQDFSRYEIMIDKELEPDRYVVQDVFETLAVYEELNDDSDGLAYCDLMVWLKDKFESSKDPMFQRLFKAVWLQKYSFKDSYPPPHPDRPSFILLNTKWMKRRGFNFVAQPLMYSLFRDIESCSDDIIEF